MLATSLDGQWAIVRRGRDVMLLANAAAPAIGRITLEDDDVDLAFVGPPTVLAGVSRGPGGSRVLLYQPPYLEAVARLDLDQPMKLAAVSGPRLVLVSLDGKLVQIVRVAARGPPHSEPPSEGAMNQFRVRTPHTIPPPFRLRPIPRFVGSVMAATLLVSERALLLVRSTDRAFAAIAADAGFCDQSHMVRKFRRLLGRTPSEIRAASSARPPA